MDSRVRLFEHILDVRVELVVRGAERVVQRSALYQTLLHTSPCS